MKCLWAFSFFLLLSFGTRFGISAEEDGCPALSRCLKKCFTQPDGGSSGLQSRMGKDSGLKSRISGWNCPDVQDFNLHITKSFHVSLNCIFF